jgi:hypothetical protein
MVRAQLVQLMPPTFQFTFSMRSFYFGLDPIVAIKLRYSCRPAGCMDEGNQLKRRQRVSLRYGHRFYVG